MAQTPVLVETQANSWAVARSSSISSSAPTASQSNTEFGSLSVGKYSGSLDLTRVVIRVLQPSSPTSPIISATISVSGTTTFTSTPSANRISEGTYIDGADTSVSAALSGMGASISDYTQTKNGNSFAGVTITAPDTTSSSANISQGSTVMFDSSSSGLTSSQLNSVFRGGSAVTFNTLNTIDTFSFARSGTDQLTAVFGGANTGQISIEYYAIPEPETWALLAFSLTTVLVLRRRRNF